jgi:hypothetical protein
MMMAAARSAGQRRTRLPGGRTVRIVVLVNPHEYGDLAVRANAAGLTVPSYLAAAALRNEPLPAAELRSALTGLTAARRLLAATAADLNTIATADVDALLAKVDDAVTGLVAVLPRGRR